MVMYKKTKTPAKAKANANKGTDVATATPQGFEQYAGTGTENITKDDLLIPRLVIIQDLSPQLKKNKPEYVEGAEVGDICDVGTGDLFKDGVDFVPVHFSKVWIEWAPRASGQGIVAIHDTDACLDDCTKNEKKQWINPAGNLIAETAQFYGLNMTAGRRRCFIAMASSQLKHSRKWNTLVMSEKLEREDGTEYTPPMFFRSYFLGSADEGNAEGDWKGWSIARGPSLLELPRGMEVVFPDAVEFQAQIASGEAKADNSDLEVERQSTAGSGSEASM